MKLKNQNIQSDVSNFKSEVVFETKITKSSKPNWKSYSIKSY